MTSSWPLTAASLVVDLQRVFGSRLRSVVAYGPQLDGDDDEPLTCLALVESLSVSDLEACAAMARQWKHRGLGIPLILPVQEFQRSLDAFPLEYGEIVRAHARVFGDDPFTDISISKEDLRRACETQVKSHLVHLREGFIESAGKPEEVADLVTTSAPAFAVLLRSVARLTGTTSNDRAESARAGATAAGLPEGVVADVLALEHRSQLRAIDAARLFPAYLDAVEQLARAVDSWARLTHVFNHEDHEDDEGIFF